MEEYRIQQDSAAWIFFAKACFILSVIVMAAGIYYLPADNWIKGYMSMGALLTVVSSIILSKTLRDQHESQKLIKRLAEVKTEKILKEFEVASDK